MLESPEAEQSEHSTDAFAGEGVRLQKLLQKKTLTWHSKLYVNLIFQVAYLSGFLLDDYFFRLEYLFQ